MKRRAILWIGLGWMAIAAPTPGAVGSCGRDDLSEPADLNSYCQEREQLICTRKYLRKEITAESRDLCRWDAIDACDRRAFRNCSPTRRETEACLRALSSFDTLETPEAEISECSRDALCGGAADDEFEGNEAQSSDGGTP